MDLDIQSYYSVSSLTNVVGNIHWQLFNDRAIEVLNVLHDSHVFIGNQIDGNSLPSKPSTASDSVDVVLLVPGQVEVDDERHLLYVNSPGKKIGRDEHSAGTGSELLHDDVSDILIHLSVLTIKCRVKIIIRNSKYILILTIADTVKVLAVNLSVSHSTFLLELTKMTACATDTVS